MNKTLSFENNKNKKQQKSNLLEQTNNKIRLSEIIKQEQQDIQEELNHFQDDNKNFIHEINSNMEKIQKKKRSKTKSKGEIRDKIDRMIDNSRNKQQLPHKTKKKWFE
jgi:hypothetical protein